MKRKKKHVCPFCEETMEDPNVHFCFWRLVGNINSFAVFRVEERDSYNPSASNEVRRARLLRGLAIAKDEAVRGKKPLPMDAESWTTQRLLGIDPAYNRRRHK